MNGKYSWWYDIRLWYVGDGLKFKGIVYTEMYVQSTNTFLSTENKYHYYTMLHVVCVLLCTIQIIIQLEEIF